MNIWEKECSKHRKQRKSLNRRAGLACSEEQQQGACVAGARERRAGRKRYEESRGANGIEVLRLL